MVVLAAVWCLPSASVSWCTDALGLFSSRLHPNSNFKLFLLTGDRKPLHPDYNVYLLGSSYCCRFSNFVNTFFCLRNTLAKVILSKAVGNWASVICFSVTKVTMLFITGVKWLQWFVSNCVLNFGGKKCKKVFFFFCIARATTNVSSVHQRRRTLTGCFVVSWELFMCSAKLSTLLRSLLFTNSAQDTRWGSAF